MVEIHDIDQSKEFFTMFNNCTLPYSGSNNNEYHTIIQL
jgi:hypothetical protein